MPFRSVPGTKGLTRHCISSNPPNCSSEQLPAQTKEDPPCTAAKGPISQRTREHAVPLLVNRPPIILLTVARSGAQDHVHPHAEAVWIHLLSS
jgi:hypothetical protein